MGKTLLSDTSGITDDNGLANATFSYQWVKNTGGADADIDGETGSTYTITANDTGAAFKVTVAFTDDAGYSESLTSSPTGPCPKRPTTGRPGPLHLERTLRSSPTRARPTIVTGHSTLSTMHRNSPPVPPAMATR